jgi:hypothetical protein
MVVTARSGRRWAYRMLGTATPGQILDADANREAGLIIEHKPGGLTAPIHNPVRIARPDSE